MSAVTDRADVPGDGPCGEGLARRLDKPMGALGLVFLLVVLGQSLAEDKRLSDALAVVGWALWLVFVTEFGLRAYTARDKGRFWARHWWQVLFLAVPFLRFGRALAFLRTARVARMGSVLSAAVRGSRSAGRLLTGRVAWLAVLTAVVVLTSSQLLYLVDAYPTYAEALHDAALATATGEPMSASGGFVRLLEVILAVYSVAVFATLAGAVGAFFLERRAPGDSTGGLRC
jgi:voltage-gated potassium channel